MTTRTRGLAALVGAVCAAALMATTATGAPAPDQPDPTPAAPAASEARVPNDASAAELPLPAGSTGDTVRIADDAVYILERGAASSTLWRRPLTTGPAGTYVGAATAIADVDTPDYGGMPSFAEHDGTLAYARASDGRLVLRDPSGTETVPTWAAAGPFTHGFTALTADWLVTDDGLSADPVVWNVHTGVQVPLNPLTPVTAGYSTRVTGVAVSDTRAVWTVEATKSTSTFAGVFTVGLDPAIANGAVEDVTTLASTTFTSGGGTSVSYSAAGTDGGIVAWTCQGCAQDGWRELQWYSGAPYTGTPAGPVQVTWGTLDLDGTALAALYGGSGAVQWYDLAGSATTPVRTWYMPGRPTTSTARFVVSLDDSRQYWLSDGTGGVVSTKPLPTDIRAGDQFATDIYWLLARGITGGYPDGTFRPGASVNRDAMAAFLYRMNHDGADAPDCTTAAFTDVPATHPFCGEIAWLASTGMTTGWPDGTFRPGQPVTREAMAAFLFRYTGRGNEPSPCSDAPFKDVAISNPFCTEIAWLADQKVSTGWPDGTFRPGLTIERQAMAAFLHRFGGDSGLGN